MRPLTYSPISLIFLLGLVLSLTSCVRTDTTLTKAEISPNQALSFQQTPVNLTPNFKVAEEPQWSPDGKQIAFMSLENPGNEEIYVLKADGSNLKNLTKNLVKDRSPIWSPNGDKIAFLSGRDGNPEVYVMNADGSGQTNLTKNSAGDYPYIWSPDSRKIAFTSSRDGDDEIYVMNADGSNATRLSKIPGYDAVLS